MNISQKIMDLTKEQGWSEYRLVKKSQLPASTVANIFHRGTIPSIATLEILCNTFGITLSQFFNEGNAVSLSEEQTELLKEWGKLSPEQQRSVMNLLKTMH